MTKYYRDFKASPLRRLQASFATAPGKAPVAPASPATITISAPVTTGSGTSQITNRVDHLFTSTDKFSVYRKESWYVITTSTNDYYVAPTSNTGVNSYATIGFRHEGSKFELMARAGDKWYIFADGAPVYTSVIAPTYVGGSGQVLRITVDFGARATRSIVCYGQQRGLGGISIGPTDSIAPIDLAPLPKIAFLTDSYGQGASSWCQLGPFGEMAMRLLGPDAFPCLSSSVDGGSGYINVGTGGTIFSQRVPYIVSGSPDLVVVAGGLNDSTGTLTSAASGVLSAIRTALPNAVIAVVGVWTPTTSYYGSGVTKHGLIYSALQAISGPWVDIDVPGGAWSNSAGASGRVGPAPWVTGTGNTTAPSGTGNADFNTSSDGTHPILAGNDYLGGNLWEGLRAGILDL